MGPVMELQKIRELIDVFKASDLAEFEFTQGDQRVRFVKRAGLDAAPVKAGAAVKLLKDHPFQPEAASAHVTDSGTDKPTHETESPTAWVVKSPLYGIVHLKPAPDAPPFVMPGDIVQQGQVVCIVEAMKIFHEIKVDRRARVENILIDSAEEVEAGAALFSLSEPN